MSAQVRPELTANERSAIERVLERIVRLSRYLQENPLPADLDSRAIYHYLAEMKAIQGNTDNGVSLVACLLAKEYLCRELDMKPFDVAEKAQGASGLDIDEETMAGVRVIGEIKTTVPYGSAKLGNAQMAAFEKDFKKLTKDSVGHRFFFVTERRTFELVRDKLATRIPGVQVVLLPSGESFVA